MRSLVNLTPLSEVQRMFDLMDRMTPGRDMSSSGLAVPMDVYEQDGKIKVRASVPGVRPEDLQLTVDNNVLTLSGEIKNEHEQKEGSRVFHREHSYGRFTRSLRLPDDIDENGVEADFENGTVTVSIPRAQRVEPQPRRVQIRHLGAGSQPQIGTSAQSGIQSGFNGQPQSQGEPIGRAEAMGRNDQNGRQPSGTPQETASSSNNSDATMR